MNFRYPDTIAFAGLLPAACSNQALVIDYLDQCQESGTDFLLCPISSQAATLQVSSNKHLQSSFSLALLMQLCRERGLALGLWLKADTEQEKTSLPMSVALELARIEPTQHLDLMLASNDASVLASCHTLMSSLPTAFLVEHPRGCDIAALCNAVNASCCILSLAEAAG